MEDLKKSIGSDLEPPPWGYNPYNTKSIIPEEVVQAAKEERWSVALPTPVPTNDSIEDNGKISQKGHILPGVNEWLANWTWSSIGEHPYLELQTWPTTHVWGGHWALGETAFLNQYNL